MKHKYSLILFIFALCILWQVQLFAQKEAAIWYFGEYAGVTFNTNPPQADTLGQLTTIEGVSMMCDRNTGSLLFYTDGLSVWNKNHQLMPNGNGLGGNSSSTQSAVVVPQPGKDSIYYVFTTAQLGQSPGACYSVVDLTLNNGLGDITIKNEVLHPSTCEKVTAAMHCNGKDYWIVFHEWMSDIFYVYPLTSAGVGNAVINGIGTIVTGSVSKTRGEIRLSPDGKKLAIANDNLGAQLFDFDNENGTISNLISLNVTPRTYGVCFSPDNTKLYITTGWTEKDIYQFDLTASNIPASQTLVGTTAASYIGSLQNAPDGKMYAATYGASYIGVITNPNAVGTACNYVDSAISLNGRICKWGLPNYPQNLFTPTNLITLNYAVDSCDNNGVAVSFSSNLSFSPDSLRITYGDGASATDLNIAHTYVGSGSYVATLTVYSGCKILEDTVTVFINSPSEFKLGNDTLICSGSSITLDASTSGGIYTWSTGASSSSIQVNKNDTYWVNVSAGSCTLTDTVFVAVQKLNPGFMYQMSCQSDTVQFVDTTSATIVSWAWDFGDGTTALVANPSHVYLTKSNYQVTLTVNSMEGCNEQFSTTIKPTASPVVGFNSSNVCLGDTALFRDTSTTPMGVINSWFWDFGDGSTSSVQHPTHLYAEAGNFNIILSITTDSGCAAYVTQQLTVYDKPVAGFALSSNMYCEKESITFDNTTQIPNGVIVKDYTWDFGNGVISRAKKPVYNYSTNGNYNITLEVTSDLGCKDKASQQVQINPLPLANVGVIDACKLDSVHFNDQSLISGGGISSWEWSFGDNTNSSLANPVHVYEEDSSYSVRLIVTSSFGCKDTAFVQVDVYEKPAVSFIPSLACSGQQVEFTNQTTVSGASSLSWSWNFGNGITSVDQHPINVYANAGTYSVELIAANGSCLDSAEQTITVYTTPTAAFTYTDSYECTSQLVEYTDHSSIANSSIESWNWNFGDGNVSTELSPLHVYSKEDLHMVSLTVTSKEGCQATAETQIETDFQEISADFFLSRSETSLLESTIDFSDNSTGAEFLAWYVGDGNIVNNELSFSHTYADTGTYHVLLVASNSQGCIDSSMKTVTIHGDNSLYIPNAFSPNGDGKNDVFTAYGVGIDEFIMRIHDRWGNQVFATDDMTKGWDGTYNGKKSTQGMYVYELVIRYANGKEKLMEGAVYLMK